MCDAHAHTDGGGCAYHLRFSPGCCGDTCTAALCLCKLQQCPCRSQRQHVTWRRASTRASTVDERIVPLDSYSMLTNLHRATNRRSWLMVDCTCWGCSTCWSGVCRSHNLHRPPTPPPPSVPSYCLVVAYFISPILLKGCAAHLAVSFLIFCSTAFIPPLRTI